MIKLKTLFILLSFTILSSAQQPGKMTRKFFADPDIEINTPSFQKKGYVRYSEIIEYLRKTIDGEKNLSMRYIGKTQKGRDIPVVIFKKPENPKSRIMLTARIHGDEPGSTESLLFLLDRLVNDNKLSCLADSLEIAILPVINIDGGEKLRRQTANGLDINRDMSKSETPESQALWRFFNEFAPDVVLDLHEYNPFRADYLQFGSFGVSSYADAMFLVCENPNYQEPLRTFVREVYLPVLRKELDNNGLRYCKYITSSVNNGEVYLNEGGGSPRSTATAFGLTNTVSLLMEIRGAGIGKSNFKRRVFTGYLIAVSTLDMAFKNAGLIKNAINKSNRANSDIVITQRRTEELKTIPFIDVQKNELTDITVPVRDAAKRTNGIVRKRPFAYALLPSQTLLAEKLRNLGIQVTILKEDFTVEAESYTISDYREGDEKYEGFYEQIVKTTVATLNVSLPKGSFIIKTGQRSGNLAAMALEPEAENGFVRYHLLPVKQGYELPIYRIINSF
jgi:hypothetical protein